MTTLPNQCDLTIEYLPPSNLQPGPHNARKHSQRQITRLKAVINEFGFTNPILVDEHLNVIAGHAVAGAADAASAFRCRSGQARWIRCSRRSHSRRADPQAHSR